RRARRPCPGRPSRLSARPRLRGDGEPAARRGHREAHHGGHRPPRRGAAGMKLVHERSRPGRRAGRVAETGVAPAEVPEGFRRASPPRLPEIAEPDLVRHFTELSTRTFGIDTGFYPLGSCTMKYNPRVNERAAALGGFRDLHPHQDAEGAQGALELMWRLERMLAEVVGLDAVTL